jgi:hypothetical protein
LYVEGGELADEGEHVAAVVEVVRQVVGGQLLVTLLSVAGVVTIRISGSFDSRPVMKPFER